VEVSSKVCVFVHNDSFTTKYPTYSAVRSLVCWDNYVYFKGTPTPCVCLPYHIPHSPEYVGPSWSCICGGDSGGGLEFCQQLQLVVLYLPYHSSSRLILLRPDNTKTNNPRTASSHYFTSGFIFHCPPNKRSKYRMSRCNKQDAQVKQVLIV
jgi:hypothetical protein